MISQMVKLAGIVSPTSNHFSLWLIPFNHFYVLSLPLTLELVSWYKHIPGSMKGLQLFPKCWARATGLTPPSLQYRFHAGEMRGLAEHLLPQFQHWTGLDLDNQLAHP